MERYLTVTVAVAHIRREPTDHPGTYVHDDLEETQVLFNESLIYEDEVKGWYYVEAIEQQVFGRGNSWHGYKGWLRKEHVSPIDTPIPGDAVVIRRIAKVFNAPKDDTPVVMTLGLGTILKIREIGHPIYNLVESPDKRQDWVKKEDIRPTKEDQCKVRLRESLIKTAMLFIGTPYLWGGRSIYMPELYNKGAFGSYIITGVDCSGLINLIYRAQGIAIPRNAEDQWLASERIEFGSLRLGDLIFVSKETGEEVIGHVMMYVGGESFIEASETGSAVRVISFNEKFGIKLKGLSGKEVLSKGKRIVPGRLIS
jgi:hypothetical protein